MLFQSTHSARSRFILSWATNASTLVFFAIALFFSSTEDSAGRKECQTRSGIPGPQPVQTEISFAVKIIQTREQLRKAYKFNRDITQQKSPASAGLRGYSFSAGSLNSVNPAFTRILYHAKHFLMSETCTRSRSYSGSTSAKAAFSFSGASLGLTDSLPPVWA